MTVKTPLKFVKSLATISTVVALNFGISSQVMAQTCTTSPSNPPSGNERALRNALQRATNTGQKVTITGTFTITSPMLITIRRDLTVDAKGATFIAANGLDGDLISLDIVKDRSDVCRYSDGRNANVKWTGGKFNISKADNSTTVPIQGRVPANRQGTASTTDALSVRAAYRNGPQRIDTVEIDGVNIEGIERNGQNFDEAGGDSGVFISSPKHGIVKNSVFKGIRDAAIYVSANDQDASMRSQFTLTDNVISKVYDGISSKRGADDITMTGNEVTDAVVGLSIKENRPGRLASKITIDDNEIMRSVRYILLENSRDVQITNNKMRGMGGKVGGEEGALGGNGAYRGVTLDGLGGTNNRVSGNRFEGDGSTQKRRDKTIIAVSNTTRNGNPNAAVTRTNNTYNQHVDERLRNE